MGKHEAFLKRTAYYFKGALELADDDDLPDGAWFQVLEDTANHLLKELPEEHQPIPKFLDGNDVVHYWLNNKD